VKTLIAAIAGGTFAILGGGVAVAAQQQSPAVGLPAASLSGVVRDVSGGPLAGVAITLQGESFSTRTDSAGHFALAGIPAGSHSTLFRRLGYRSVEYRWVAEGNRELQVAVTMTPVPRALDRLVVEAPGSTRRRGTSSIGGVVTDFAGQGVVGADVRLLGSGLSTMTDSNGTFEFQSLAAGPYIVRARRMGLSSGTYVTQLADDDNRGITLKLYELPKKTGERDVPVASGYGIADLAFDAFDRRARTASRDPILGPADLFRRQGESLDLTLQQYRDPAATTRPSFNDAPNEGDCLIVDGRRATYQPLRTFVTHDVQMVEIFRKNAFVDAYIVSQMEGVRECRGTMDHHPPYFVLWTRRLR
jgi:hypothetical protein